MTVGDIMSQPALTVSEDATLEDVARIMLDRGIGGLPVVDAEGHLRGIVTESDFCGRECFVPFSAYKLPRMFGQWMPTDGVEAIYRTARAMKAGAVMSHPVVTTTEDEPISSLVRRMIERNIKRLPVVRGDIPIGMITRHDLLRLMANSSEGR